MDYAQNLGFSPHADFQEGKEIVGDHPDNLIPLEFGKDGKPFYFSGPYDNPQRIIQTLERTVGKGYYDYIIETGPNMDMFAD